MPATPPYSPLDLMSDGKTRLLDVLKLLHEEPPAGPDLSVRSLHRILGVSRATIANWENPDHKSRPDAGSATCLWLIHAYHLGGRTPPLKTLVKQYGDATREALLWNALRRLDPSLPPPPPPKNKKTWVPLTSAAAALLLTVVVGEYVAAQRTLHFEEALHSAQATLAEQRAADAAAAADRDKKAAETEQRLLSALRERDKAFSDLASVQSSRDAVKTQLAAALRAQRKGHAVFVLESRVCERNDESIPGGASSRAPATDPGTVELLRKLLQSDKNGTCACVGEERRALAPAPPSPPSTVEEDDPKAGP